MPQLIPNQFTSYDLTQEEFNAGCTLTDSQRMVLQNELSELAGQKINLVFDPDNIAAFTVESASLQGQMDAIINILAKHNAALDEVAYQGNHGSNSIATEVDQDNSIALQQ